VTSPTPLNTDDDRLLALKRESLGLLAGSAAHDFNNLLTAIVSSVGLLLRDLPAESSSYESALLIKKAAERATSMTRQLLQYAGKNVPVRRALDISDWIRGVLEPVSAILPRNATIVPRLASDLPCVQIDPVQMQQALTNLLINACEATAATGGSITVTTGSESANPSQGVFIDVADDGCGISPDAEQRVFDPFFSTKGRGRGLGLSVVQGIVMSHGGQVRFTTGLDQGTCVRIVLPAGQAAAQLSPAEPRDETVPLTLPGSRNHKASRTVV